MDCLECEEQPIGLVPMMVGDVFIGAVAIPVSTETMDKDRFPTDVGLMDGLAVSFAEMWQQSFVRWILVLLFVASIIPMEPWQLVTTIASFFVLHFSLLLPQLERANPGCASMATSIKTATDWSRFFIVLESL